MIKKTEKIDSNYIHRSNWLRAVVLGANDGILSTVSIAIGVAAATDVREPVILATLAGLVAGALSMAAGEYVSVSSQKDTENADIERNKKELNDKPIEELHEMYWDMMPILKHNQELLLSQKAIDNRLILRQAMTQAGFTGIDYEWWHFNAFSRKVAKQMFQVVP